MSYTHNMHEQYRDIVRETREEVSESRKEFLKLVGASGFSVLAAAACDSDSAPSSMGSSVAVSAEGVSGNLVTNDYESILSPVADGWYYLSAFREDYRFMNYGTTGSIPNTVLAELATWHYDVAENPAGPLPWQVSNAVIRANCSKDMYGCLPQEMSVTFNTTDSMSKIAAGIKWKRNDIVLMTNNEHSGGLGPISIIANRYGVKLREVNIPTGVSKGANTGGYAEDGTVVARFEEQYQWAVKMGFTPRAIMFSSPPYTLGWRLEEKALSEWAISKGKNENGDYLRVIIDGAHIPGSAPIDLHEIGCDYFGATAAKWQCGPGQTGYAYVRMGKKGDSAKTTFQGYEVTTNDWTNPLSMEPFYINSAGYTHFATSAGYKGMWNLEKGQDLGGSMVSTGNPNYPTLKTLYEINKLWQSIGRVNIAKYNQSLAQYLRQSIAQNDKMGLYSLGVDFQTPLGVVPTGRANETVFPLMLQTGLTAFNPFSPNRDFNADLTPEQSTAQAAASRTIVQRLEVEYGLVVRNISTKHQLRSNPAASARNVQTSGQRLPEDQINVSSPLRISTHLYTRVSDVDRLMSGLSAML